MDIDAPESLEPAWRALSNPLRRRMLDLLRDGPKTTGELADLFTSHSRFAVMQHLGVLEEGGLVVQRRDGRRRMNHLNPLPIQQIYDLWVSRYQQVGAYPPARVEEGSTIDSAAPSGTNETLCTPRDVAGTTAS